jgi:DNA-binding CsgD family transcriptional regulator
VVSPPAPGAVDPAFARRAREQWGLTPREVEVVWLVYRGVRKDADIAACLGISPITAQEHAGRVRRKMGLEPGRGAGKHLMTLRALDLYERLAIGVNLAALADDFAALARLTRGVMTYLDGEGT